MSERDPKTGRFLPGNRCAEGNRGNRRPKWGNKNAVKHGFFARGMFDRWRRPHVDDDGWLRIPQASIKLSPHVFYIENGGIYIRQDILDELRAQGL